MVINAVNFDYRRADFYKILCNKIKCSMKDSSVKKKKSAQYWSL